MDIKRKTDVGVIVARFQVPTLHEAHLELINTVTKWHDKVIIFLGISPCKTTYNNPLDFEARKQMLLEKFPDIIVLYIKDEPSDEKWSKNLDVQITDILGPKSTATLYGGRDSFIKHYSGKFSTQELEQTRFISGTEIRKEISRKVKASPDFRAGVIWAVNNQFPTVHPTVDIAIVDRDKWCVLMAKKPTEWQYRFIGGFATPNSETFEADAAREISEETGLEVDNLQYIGSAYIDDWRYRQEQNRIKTLFFIGTYVFGSPEAGDDVSEVAWIDIDDLEHSAETVVPEHRVLVQLLLGHVNQNKRKGK